MAAVNHGELFLPTRLRTRARAGGKLPFAVRYRMMRRMSQDLAAAQRESAYVLDLIGKKELVSRRNASA